MFSLSAETNVTRPHFAALFRTHVYFVCISLRAMATPFLSADTALALLALGWAGLSIWRSEARAGRSGSGSGESSPPAVSTSHLGMQCRRHFYLDWQFAHCNHGSYGTAPRAVVEEASSILRGVEAFPDHFMRRRVAREYKEASDIVARFVAAPPGSVVLLENATTAVNAVLRSLPPSSSGGRELWVMLDQTYNACALALRAVAAARGADVVVLKVPLPAASPEDITAALASALAVAVTAAGLPRAHFLLLDHIASATGLLFPAAELVAACRPHAEFIMVDGAHAPGMLDLNLPALGADWYTGNLHKWCFSSKGTAFLHCRDELQAGQMPLVVSHLIHARDWRDRFWMQGTADFSRALAVPAALDFMRRELGVEAMRAYNSALCDAATARLCALWGTAPLLPQCLAAPFMRSIETPLDWRKFAADAPPGGDEAARLAAAVADPEVINQTVAGAIFTDAGVQGQFAFWVVGGRPAIYSRISTQVYSTMDDFERLGEAVLSLHRRVTPSDRHW